MDENEISNKAIGIAIDIHRALGPGLLESAYQACFCREISLNKIPFRREVAIPVEYKGVKIDCAYRADIIVDKKVILEIKAVEKLLPIHQAQLLTYLRLTELKLGLLINFNVPVLKDGIRRVANKL